MLLLPADLRRLMSLCLLTALLATAVSACGGGGTDSDAATSGPAWVVLGSSTAAGVGALPGDGWVAQLGRDEAARGIQVRDLAVAGLTTYGALPAGASVPAGRPRPDAQANIDAALAVQPRLLLVSFPNNDTVDGFSVDETVANLLRIRATAQAHGVPVVMLSTQPRDLPPAQLALLPQVDARVAAAAGACFVPVRQALAGADGRIAPQFDAGDGVHLNDDGHAVVLQHVRAVLNGGACVIP